MLGILLYFLGMAGLVAGDQLTKLWAVNCLQKVGTKPLLGDFVNFTFVTNNGAAFNILQGQKVLLIAVPLIFSAVCIALIAMRKMHSVIGNISLMLIAAGGIGNLIDRIFRGYVVDFIYVEKIHFAIFNVADSCVCVGVALLVIYLILSDGTIGRNNRRSEIFTKRRRR